MSTITAPHALLIAAMLAIPAAAQTPTPEKATEPAAPAAPATPSAPAAQPPQAAQPEPAAQQEPGTLPAAMQIRGLVIEAQVLLDRANFSPGAIDGLMGSNVRSAVASWQRANGLRADGRLTPALVARMRAADPRPILVKVAVSPTEANGPFSPPVKSSDYAAMAKLERVGYRSSREAVAERFHMDEAFLAALNPGTNFSAGDRIIVANVDRSKLARSVARIDVNKRAGRVSAFDADGKLLASYPATVGSDTLPSPTGRLAVRTVAPAPTYTYDPDRLSFGDKSQGKLVIPAGPNNPVGATWIDLTKDTYGIHGTPEPSLIGKRASNGCVRLTNWDAQQLGASVEAGTTVVFS